MLFMLLVLALAVFLAGATAGTLALIIVSIHRSGRARFLSSDPKRHAGAIARRALIGIRNDREEDK